MQSIDKGRPFNRSKKKGKIKFQELGWKYFCDTWKTEDYIGQMPEENSLEVIWKNELTNVFVWIVGNFNGCWLFENPVSNIISTYLPREFKKKK